MNVVLNRYRALLICVLWAGAAANVAAQNKAGLQPPQPLDVTMRDDAALVASCFVSEAEGWVVGERGVILHTRDGGATWQPQESHVQCALRGVFFLDAARGWAFGGATKPFGQGTVGALLVTVDGGATWIKSPAGDMLPALSGVRFFNPQIGIAYGASSAMYPSGVCVTRDGGRSWQAVACDAAGDWLAADFLDATGGALAGADGRFATFANAEVKQSLAAGSLRSLHAMRLAAPAAGWVVGDGGLVGRTNDLGRSWQSPEGELPGSASQQFDFHAVAVQGDNVWVAGAPGTRVFHSADAGRTWQAQPTGLSVPIFSLTFVDAIHGWAAGELGTILATHDGGRTWHVQRSGGRRAALLNVFARTEDVPLEVTAQQGAAEGYLSSVQVLFRSPARPASVRSGSLQAAGGRPAEQSSAATAREAMLLAGATTAEIAWQFPLPDGDASFDAESALAELNRANEGRAAERMISALVRKLRMWRPDVVVTHSPAAAGGEQLSSVASELTLQAVEAAADSARFPDLAEAGLEPWQVKRVYGVLPSGGRGHEKIVTGQFTPQLGVTLGDWSAPARRLVTGSQSLPPDSIELALLVDRVGNERNGGRGLFRGINLPPGGDARRRVADLPVGDVDQLRRVAARRRNLEELLERKAGDAGWAAQVVKLTEGLPDEAGGELIFQLADGYRATGRPDLAADTYYLLARRYADHPLTEQALRWLVQYYASSEAGTRMSGASLKTTARISAPQTIRTGKSEFAPAESEVQQTSATAPIRGDGGPAVALSLEDRLRRAVELGKYLEAARPQLFAEPSVRFPLVAAERQLGFANPAKRYFLSLHSLPESDAWRQCAVTEEWLAEPRDMPPAKLMARCRRASERPHLDGVLDEAFWQAAEVIRMPGALATRNVAAAEPASSIEHPTTVRLAYDSEFLYIAVECAKAEDGDYRTDDHPRPHDADLTTHDRISIRFDFDRDYTTSCELAVDHRGWTSETNLGDVSWNPNWYVAAASDETSWKIEAAVPLTELVERAPAARAVWAIGVRRSIPREGTTNWAGVATSGDSPDDFGLLIFE